MLRIYDWNFSGTVDVVVPALLAGLFLMVGVLSLF
jgi:hypothetical protein